MRALCLSLIASACALSASTLTACDPPRPPIASPADLQRLGSRYYGGYSREAGLHAAVTALRILGYEIVTTDPRIRTAPKPLSVTAVGNRYSAHTVMESVAWEIDVQEGGGRVVFNATWHLYFNGTESQNFYLEMAEGAYNQLYSEIERNFPSTTTPPTPPPSAPPLGTTATSFTKPSAPHRR